MERFFHREFVLLHCEGNEDDILARNLDLEPRAGDRMSPRVPLQSGVADEARGFLFVFVNNTAVFRGNEFARDA